MLLSNVSTFRKTEISKKDCKQKKNKKEKKKKNRKIVSKVKFILVNSLFTADFTDFI